MGGQAAPWFTPPVVDADQHQATVIGAGLAGVSTACHLHELGWQVTLIDRNERFALGTSGNPAGLIKPQTNSNNIHVSNYYKKYFEYFVEYLDKLLEVDSSIQHGLAPLSIQQQDHTCFAKSCAWLCPIDFCRAQLRQHSGITTLYNVEVATLSNEAGRWQCISSNGETISDTPICVLSSGHEINLLLKNRLSIEPLSGQISLLSEQAITPPIKSACYKKHYLIPLYDNTYVCGASHHRHASLEETQIDHDENLDGLSQLLPNHKIDKSQIIGSCTGVRAVSPDHLPIVGGIIDEAYYLSMYDDLHHGKKPELYTPAQYQRGLFVLAALGSHGIGNSPYLGKLLSDLINGSIDDFDQQVLQLIHPARFLIRDLKRKPIDRKQPSK